AKFVGPTVANGRVYVPTFANSVAVYGLLNGMDDSEPVISYLGNGASYQPQVVSPGGMVAIFGSNLGPGGGMGVQLDSNGALTSNLAGTRVLFDGVAAPMVFAGLGQVNAMVPFGVASGSTHIQVQTDAGTSAPVEMLVQNSSPGLFTADGSGRGQALAVNPDGTVNSPDNPAPAGSIVILYATGVGKLSPDGVDGAVGQQLKSVVLPVTATLGDQAATVLYAGTAPGIVEGVVQVNLKIPEGTAADPALPLTLTVGKNASLSGVTLSVRN